MFVYFYDLKNRLFPQNRTEQNRTKQKSKSKPKQAKKLRKGLGQRLDVTPKEAARAPGSTFQKVAFWRPTRVR